MGIGGGWIVSSGPAYARGRGVVKNVMVGCFDEERWEELMSYFLCFAVDRPASDSLCQLGLREDVSRTAPLYLSNAQGADHSPLFIGYSGQMLLPSSFAGHSSRGNESLALTVYMRWTVLALESVSWWPVVVLWCWSGWGVGTRSKRTRVSE